MNSPPISTIATFLTLTSLVSGRPLNWDFAVSEQLHTARAASLSSVLILLDLSTAFDTVNHQILISSLQDLGVSGSALSLLSSYLNDCTYRVTWRGSDMVKPYTPAHSLRSASANGLVAASLRAKHSTKLRLFAVLAPRWWNELLNDIRTESLYIFCRKLKTHLFQLYLE